MDRFDYLIVGAGFAGSVCAERLASAGKRVLLIDQRNHVGGNAYDYYDEAGILVHKYGPHIFHTNSPAVFEYLSQFTEWRRYEHRVLASVNGQLLPVPINRTTLAAFGGDHVVAVSEMYAPYTRKQWGAAAAHLHASVQARVKVRDTDDDRYFTDDFKFMPRDGYTKLFERMLAHKNITVLLNTSHHQAPKIVAAAPYAFEAGIAGYPEIISTGPIDEYFDHRFGRLPYRSATFERITYDFDRFQPVAVVNHPAERVPFTRITEFKHLTGQRHAKTSIAIETPTDDGDPYWPVPTAESAALYKKYEALARATPGVHFCGRLGTYKYYDIDQVVAQALKLARTLTEDTCETSNTA